MISPALTPLNAAALPPTAGTPPGSEGDGEAFAQLLEQAGRQQRAPAQEAPATTDDGRPPDAADAGTESAGAGTAATAAGPRGAAHPAITGRRVPADVHAAAGAAPPAGSDEPATGPAPALGAPSEDAAATTATDPPVLRAQADAVIGQPAAQAVPATADPWASLPRPGAAPDRGAAARGGEAAAARSAQLRASTPGLADAAAGTAAVAPGVAGPAPSGADPAAPVAAASAVVAPAGDAATPFAAALAAATPPAPPAAAATATATAYAPADARLPAPPGTPAFAAQMSTQVTTFVRQGLHHAVLELNPADMGPVTVQIQLDGATAQVHLSAEHATTRQALAQAMPQLAGTLREAGLTLAGGGVFEQPRQPPSDPGRGGGRGDDRGRRGTRSDAVEGLSGVEAPATAVRRRGVVDLQA